MATSSGIINVTIDSVSRRFLIVLPQNFTLADFRKSVEECFGDINSHRFICRGRTIPTENEAVFNERKNLITNGTCICICQKMVGGGGLGVEFVDLSNPNGPTRRKWSSNAPVWRLAGYGLCLEGKCNNNSCEAYQQQVIVKFGFGKFDLLEDPVEKSKCPMCDKYVEPITCAFSKCRWRWHGIKKTHSGMQPEKISADWKIADNAYHVFDEKISGMAVWLKLVIEIEQT